MKAYLVESPAGLFLLEKTGKIAEKALFPRNPRDAAGTFGEVRNGTLPNELAEFADKVSRFEIEQLTVDNEAMAKVGRSLGLNVVLDEKDETANRLRNRLPSILVRLRLVESKDEYEKFVRDVSMELAKTSIAEAAARRDLYAIQMVRCIEDLDKVLNLLASRIREWYGLHFPELDGLVEKHDSYVRLVLNLATRDSYTEESLAKLGIPESRAHAIAEAAARSSGASIPAPDLESLKEICGSVLQLYKLRDFAEKYTEKIMGEVAPNLTTVLGAVLSAKLLSIAGGVENIAKMPSSTLQVLGAEKALFRTLTTGARPPKHGVIFQYAPIHQAPKWLRGKIARAVAGKLAIAARMDAYGGGDVGEKMRADLDGKIKSLRERYQERPVKKTHGEPWRNRETSREGQRGLLDTRAGSGKEARYYKPGPRDNRLRRERPQRRR